ncbi:hypothetical protein ACFQBQ_12775 [Granulicella cerasi]|uniref:Uncharacterized protein n=1 Tax=Granulicella cerasi TaxID=741063 RepID=A0ABW1ZAL8_9BACT|nr:hypothetical protein [Granulicella cerasi]
MILKKKIAAMLALPALVAAAQTPNAPQVMTATTLREAILQHGSSGTSIEPASTPVPMWMGMKSGWTLMLHANAFAANEQQQAASERGRDAWFSTNWIMPMAQRQLGPGELTLRAMFSAEPGTMQQRNYPLLFQQGETAYGAPIVDGQHPHDFFMEVAALYDVKLGKNALLSFYAAPIGDPAIGPTAYPHRQSASEDPVAALGHHQEDSTHIAFNVFTGGLTYKWARAEVSGFHGGEPSEAHWHFQPSPNGHAVDSWATRLTVSPNADWSGQYSYAHVASPEALYPHEDQQRQTASVMYHHTFKSEAAPAKHDDAMAGMDMSGDMAGMDMSGMDHSQMNHAAATSAAPPMKMPSMSMHMAAQPVNDLSITALWGRTKSLDADASKQNSYLLEALYRFKGKNYVWTRMENAGRSSELLLTPGTSLPTGFHEDPVGHVAAFTFGYDRDFAVGRHLLAAPGAQVTLYRSPALLAKAYGDTPTGEVFFVRFRLR